MNFLNIVTIAFFICYWPALLMYVALTNVLRALWFKAQGEDKWWIALIPCGHLYFDRMLAGVPIIAIVFMSDTPLINFSAQKFSVRLCFLRAERFSAACHSAASSSVSIFS